MTDFKQVRIGELLEEGDYNKVVELINDNKWDELKVFLNSINDKLMKRGILPDYLYYCLKNMNILHIGDGQ
jgi:hypothetical protein